MLWASVRAGFQDELTKISEMSLAGLSTETLMSYPKPEPMPSAAFDKAQAIIAKMQPKSEEKTASPKPDMLPALKRITRRRRDDPPPDKLDTALSYGGNTLGGAGAAKFLGDWVEKTRTATGKSGFSDATKASIMAAGGSLALANKIRKEHRRKKWQAGHHV